MCFNNYNQFQKFMFLSARFQMCFFNSFSMIKDKYYNKQKSCRDDEVQSHNIKKKVN